MALHPRAPLGVFFGGGHSKLNFYEALVQHELKETFWIDFGKGWARFGCVLVEMGLSKLKLLRHMVIS